MNHLKIKNKLISFNEHNEGKKIQQILESIDESTFAIVSDAGTPTISDPGSKLVRALLASKKKVIPLPGASSLITAYSASGMKNSDFIFCGFPPKKEKDIKLLLNELKTLNKDIIFFESPLRTTKFLKFLRKDFTNSNIVISREISKIHEEIILWEPSSEFPKFKKVKGEMVIIVERDLNTKSKKDIFNETEALGKLEEFVNLGLSGRDSVKKVSSYLGVSQKKIYNIYLQKFVNKI
jgi:16S rRNA (cytidine1402-2'-O)-methyltransferase